MPTIYVITQDGNMNEEYYPTLKAADDASDSHEDDGSLVFFSWFNAMNALGRVSAHSELYKDRIRSWVND